MAIRSLCSGSLHPADSHSIKPRTASMQQMLNTNFPPLGSDSLIETKNATARHLHELDEAIAATPKGEDVSSLIHRRREVSRDLDDLKSITHPMRKLSSEMLCEIFSNCIEEVDNQTEFEPTLVPNYPPRILIQVCRRWRAVGLSFHKLWSSISLRLDPFPSQSMCRLLESQIERSGTYPLSIWIAEEDIIPLDTTPNTPSLMDILLPTTHRWEILVATFIGNFDILSPLCGSLVKLRKVHLQLEEEDNVTPTVAAFLQTAKNLRDVTVAGVSDIEHRVPLPWAEITCFDSRCLPGSHPGDVDVLLLATNLERCLTNGTKPLIPRIMEPTPLPNLLSLHIGAEREEGATQYLMDACTFPNLTSLQIDWPNTLVPIISSFRSSPPPPVTRLIMGSNHISSFTSLLELLPSLEELYMEHLDQQMLSRFTAHTGTGTGTLVPRLRKLVVRALWGDDQSLVDMFESRCFNSGRAENVSFVEEFKLCMRVGALDGMMDRLVDAGMRFSNGVEWKGWF